MIWLSIKNLYKAALRLSVKSVSGFVCPPLPQELDNFPGSWTIENLYVASLMYPWDIHHVKNHQDSCQELPASS